MDYKDVNDYELVYRIRENDNEDALNVLVKKYEPLIVGLAKKYYVKVKYQGADMSDLLQEGRIALVKALNSYDPNHVSLFYTYVSICIERHFITFCRNLGALKHGPLNYSVSDDYLYNVSDNSVEPDYCLNRKLDECIICEGKNLLNFLDSNIFELRYNGFSYNEICELLDVSYSVVSRRLCKIRKTLQVLKNKF